MVLNELGLTLKEQRVYLALMKIGSGPASVLAKMVGMPRATAQYTCKQLLAKRVVRMVEKGNSFIYMVEPPDKLIYLLDQERRRIDEKEERLRKVLPELEGLRSKATVLPKVKIFEGVEGVIELYNDLLEELTPETKLYGVVSLNLNPMHERLERYQWEEYVPRRKEIKNPSWFVFNESEETKEFQKLDSEMNRKSVFVPGEKYYFGGTFQMYNNKLAFYSDEDVTPMGVLIENRQIFDTQMALMRLVWDYARGRKVNERYKETELGE